MEAFLLTLAAGSGGSFVVPRKVTLTLLPGCGSLRASDGLRADHTWWQSVANAWRAALRLTQRNDVDGRIDVRTDSQLLGGSAGLAVGLLALDALVGRSARTEHFSTGAVVDSSGMLVGGAAADLKSAAAAVYAPQLGMKKAVLVTPPIEPPLVGRGCEIIIATDIASAYAKMAPEAYRNIAAQHRDLRAATAQDLHRAGENGSVVVVEHAQPLALPDRVATFRVVHRENAAERHSVRITVIEDRLLLWQTTVTTAPDFARELERIVRLARMGAVR